MITRYSLRRVHLLFMKIIPLPHYYLFFISLSFFMISLRISNSYWSFNLHLHLLSEPLERQLFIFFLRIHLRRIFVERSVITFLIAQLRTLPFLRRYGNVQWQVAREKLAGITAGVHLTLSLDSYLPADSPFKPKSIGACSDLISIPEERVLPLSFIERILLRRTLK